MKIIKISIQSLAIMTLYFDTKLQFPDEETISTVADIHQIEPVTNLIQSNILVSA